MGASYTPGTEISIQIFYETYSYYDYNYASGLNFVAASETAGG